MLACDLGADAIGFIFHEKTPRHIRPSEAQLIARSLPPFVTKVGVFVNMPIQELGKICETVPLDLVQLHGDEPTEYCRQVDRPWLKVFRVSDEFDVSQLAPYKAIGFLLDTFNQERYGGTGQTFNWKIAKEAKRFGQIILSGGLNPQNVSEAMNFVKPYAVDVCSGVEAVPGKKDPEKMRRFFGEISCTAKSR